MSTLFVFGGFMYSFQGQRDPIAPNSKVTSVTKAHRGGGKGVMSFYLQLTRRQPALAM